MPSSAYAGDPAAYHRSRGLPAVMIAQSLQRLFARVPIPQRALDIGIGTGRIGQPLARYVPHLVGLDLSERMLRFLQRAEPPPSLTLVQGDALALPFPSASFDAVITVHVLHLVADLTRALHEVRRVLRPGGWFALGLLEHTPNSPIAWAQGLWHTFLRRAGYPKDHPGWRSYAYILQQVRAQGAQPVAYVASEPWVRWISPREVWRGVREKRFSPYWGLSRWQHARLSRVLARAFQARFGWRTEPLPDVRRFAWHVFRWPA
ncbi:MAG: methyltransferase domain-containing protein [Chloroflexi bacterium]|nr:methyltransferase domain-containing protein [Chloroflexota bacterium]